MHLSNEELTIKTFLDDLEARRRVARRSGGTVRPRIVMSSGMAAAVRRRSPAVVRRTRLGRVHVAVDELLQEFFPVADEVGLDRYDPSYTYGQYVTWMLFEAARRLGGAYPADPSGAWTAAEREAGAADGPTGEGDDGGLAPKGCVADPLQTCEQVREVLAGLSEALRTPALRVWVDGLSIALAAAEARVSVNALHLRLSRVRRTLSARTGVPLGLRRRESRPRRKGTR
jgi:hypothetical protein